MPRRIQIGLRSRPRETDRPTLRLRRLRVAGPSPRLTAEQQALADVVAFARSPLPELSPAEEAALEPTRRRP